jgi:sarcosine oxidase
MTNRFDVIVIGMDAMAAATCWYLCKHGIKILGLGQLEAPNNQLSQAAWKKKIERKAYYEHPDYIPLLQRAYKNWKDLEIATATQIYYKTGILYFGDANGSFIDGLKQSAQEHATAQVEINSAEVASKFPLFKNSPTHAAIYEPDAGFVVGEQAVSLYTSLSVAAGVEIKRREKVLSCELQDDFMLVKTNEDSYKAKQVVICGGAWASSFIKEVRFVPLVTKQIVVWMNPLDWAPFMVNKFPSWFIEDEHRGVYYGFPIIPPNSFGGPVGLKIVHHLPGVVSDVDAIDKGITKDDEESIRYFLAKYLPSANSNILGFKTCFHTYFSEEHFIIDQLPAYNNKVTIACGFNGDGFKLASVIGEILADLAIKGDTNLPIDFLRIDKFTST